MEIPVYLFTGLIESGKTTLIHEVAAEEGFLEPGRTLLIRTEEGEEDFSEAFLKKYNMTLLNLEDPQDMTRQFWRNCEEEYKPAQIMIEYNGMWQMDTFFLSGFPGEWFIGGIYSTINADTVDLYLTNMRKMFMEPLKDSNLIIVNRCTDEIDRMKLRRNLKALNPQVQVAFEKKDGTMFAGEDEVMPFDYSGQEVIIEDMDYGLWYLDAMDHPGRYLGKEITFVAKYCASSDDKHNYFVPGRHIMTCCADDIQFLGFVCSFNERPPFKHEDWVKVKVKFDYGPCEMYGEDEEGPILQLEQIEAAQKPEQELVTFS